MLQIALLLCQKRRSYEIFTDPQDVGYYKKYDILINNFLLAIIASTSLLKVEPML